MTRGEGDQDLDGVLVQAVERAGRPVPLVTLVASLPRTLKTPPGRVGERVAALCRQGRLAVWPGRPELIALEGRDAWIRSRILQTLHAAGPLTLSELNRRLGKSLARHRPAVLATLCEEGLVKRHPRLGRRVAYSLSPPDPGLYLRPGLEKLLRALERLGFSRTELWRALSALAGPPPAPGRSAGPAGPPAAGAAGSPARAEG